MTTGDGLGIEATGKTAEQAFACLFEFRDMAIIEETHVFDLAYMCEQRDIPLTAVKAILALIGRAAA